MPCPTPRPWSVIPVYVATLTLSVVFATSITTARSIDAASSGPFQVAAWHVFLAIGSVVALAGACSPTRLMLGGKVAEAVGASVVGVEVGVYGVTLITDPSGPSPAWVTITLALGVALACMVRTVAAMRERAFLLRRGQLLAELRDH